MNRLFLPLVQKAHTLSGAKTLGGDVSKWQGLMDWNKALLGGWNFTFIRLGSIQKDDGVCYTDYQYERNADIAPAFMYTGPYWYFRPAYSGIVQADYATEKLEGKHFSLPFVLDCENNDTKLPNYYVEKKILEFVDHLYDNTGKWLMIYTSKGWWSWPNIYAYDKRPEWASMLHLWVANYTPYPSPAMPATWLSAGWKFWQFTDEGDGLKYGVPQDTGAPRPTVDLDWFNGDKAELKFFVDQYNGGGNYSWSPSPSLEPTPSLAPTPSPEPPVSDYTQMRVVDLDGDNLNVRTGPGTNYPIIDTLEEGEIVEVHDVAGQSAWVQIEEGRWAASQYQSKRYLEPIS